jgi:large repetitive protein
MKGKLPALLLFAAASASAQPTLVKDVNTTDVRGPFTFAADLAQIGGVVFFGFTDSTHGYELWRSDGTAAGTQLVKDLCPGACSSLPFDLTVLGSTLYFAADDGAHGRELWKTDGTEAGTVLVKDVVPGLSGSSPRSLFELDGSLLFDALTPEGGQALWISDGTAEATTLLKTFPVPVFPLAPLGSTMLLGTEGALWRTDGTEAGTVLVKNITPAEPNPFLSGVSPCAVFSGRLYLSADDGASGYELWSTDGTPAGTVQVKDIGVGLSGSLPRGLTVQGDHLLFSTGGSALWKTDGTEAGTVLVKAVTATEMAVLGNQALFRSYHPASGVELWKTDGTEAGTVLVKPIGASTIVNLFLGLTPMTDRLVFLADDGVHGVEPWVSDATGAGTLRLADLSPPAADPFQLSNLLADHRLVVGGLWYYRNLDADGSVEMFVTDGTEAGTRQLTEINHHASAFYLDIFQAFTMSKTLADSNGTLLFQADDGAAGAELWKTDGTAPGTVQVADLAPGPNGSYPSDLTPLGSRTLFNAGYLWTSDGTSAGTFQLVSLEPGNLTRAGNSVYFVSGGTLHKTDGTALGTVALHTNNYLYQLSAFGNLLLFASQDAANNSSLWRTDGTPAGTFQLGSSRPGSLHKVGSRMFFAAEDPTAGRELWMTDGTVAGTVRVKDINPGTGSGILFGPYDSSWPPLDWADLDGRFLLFPADDGTGDGEELWISNGTASGTFQLADINAVPGGGPSEIRWLTGTASKVYFVADDGTHGRELWVTDGTWTGTRRLTDLAPGEASSLPEQLQPVGTQLLFSAHTPDAGREPWITDGDEVGTRRLADLAPGALPSTPQAFIPSGSRVYFVATDAETGFELYAVPRSEVDGSMDFYTVPPCRLVDTRQSGGPLTPNVPRTVEAAGHCGIPATAKALAVNVTAIGLAGQGNVTVHRAGTQPPGTNTLSVSAGQTRAADTMVLLGDGAIAAVARPETLSVQLVVDVTGYFQ